MKGTWFERLTNKRSISSRIAIPYLLLTLFLVVLLTGLLYQTASTTITRKSAEYLYDALENIDGGISSLVQDLTQSAKHIISNSDVQNINELTPLLSGTAQTSQFSRIQELCGSILTSKTRITEIVLYNRERSRILTSRLYLRSSEDTDWSLPDVIDEGATGFEYLPGQDAGLLRLVMPIRSLKNFSLIGYVQFGVNRGLLTPDFHKLSNRLSGNAYLITSEGSIAASVRNLEFENQAEVIEACLEGDNPDAIYSVRVIQGSRMISMPYRLSALPWTFLLIAPQSSITGDLETMGLTSLILGVVMILLTWLMTLIISRGISMPIIRVADAMKRFEGGDFSVRCPESGGNEISYLSASFNRMITEIDRLVNQVYKLQILEKEHENRFLQAQIKPHFLYNTLDTIHYLAMENKVPEISSMVMALSNLFRAAISTKNPLVSVEKDLGFAEEYLKIMRLRFGKKLNIRYEIDENILHGLIPKLTLQPLIENAVQHGLEQKTGGWHIGIRGRLEHGSIVLSIEDNGAGISKDKLEQLNLTSSAEDSERPHLGVQLVSKRLGLLFGERAAMNIQSVQGEGTMVTLTLPLLTEESNVSDTDSGG